MKCINCDQRKGKRYCERLKGLICSRCCGNIRDITYCDSCCDYMKEEKYQVINIRGMEMTEVGRGKVVLFSEGLFLPNLYKCLRCEVQELTINIIEPTRVSVYTKFVIKKRVTRDVNIKEAYVIDSWKIGDDNSSLLPFLQIYAIGLGKINNIKLEFNDIQNKVEIENNHLDTWLPGMQTKMERLTNDEIKALNAGGQVSEALVYYGEHFLGRNSTLFSEIELEREYRLKFEILYEQPQFNEKHIVLPLGIFFPFELVNYKNYKINIASGLEINFNSETNLLLPFEEKQINAFMMPLTEQTNMLSAPQYVPYKTNQIESCFYYDRYCILQNNFRIELGNRVVAKAIFSESPILVGIYDTVNKVYENEYAPVAIAICNNTEKIEKYKLEVEILGLSYKATKEVYAEPFKAIKESIAPRLIEEKILRVTSNTEFDIYVKASNEQGIIYEETEKCLVYPKEIFVETLKNKSKDWKLDLKSFLARWVTPSIPQIDEIVAEAGKGIGIVGSASNNTYKMQREMKSIYDLLGERLEYVNRTLAFTEGDYHAQRISLPSTTLKLNSGNCIDLTVLLASCYEALKLQVFIILIPGHAFLQVKLAENENVYIECTYIGKKEYSDAIECGREKYDKYFNAAGPKENNAFIIDVELSRKSKIYPME